MLSGQARDTAPCARGSDYSDIVASIGLVHRWQGEGESGPSSAGSSTGPGTDDTRALPAPGIPGPPSGAAPFAQAAAALEASRSASSFSA